MNKIALFFSRFLLPLLAVILLLAAAVSLIGPAVSAELATLKPPRGGWPPNVCPVEFHLAPGERSVELCQIKPGPYAGIVVVQSGHESVDAVLIRSHTLGHVIALTNRSTDVVAGTALVELH